MREILVETSARHIHVTEEQFKQLPIQYPDPDKNALDELSFYLGST